MGKSHYKRYKEYLDLSIQFNTIKSLVIATIGNPNMKAFTMSCLVFFIVAITIIAMAEGGDMGVCEEHAEKIGKCQKENDAEACCAEQGIPDYCFGYCLKTKQRQLRSVDGIGGPWHDQIEECHQGSEEDLLACCKNKGVPFEWSGYCRMEGGVCQEWEQVESECREGNEGKECCEEQGVPRKCSAYCETA